MNYKLTTCFWCNHCLQVRALSQDPCHLAADLLMCLQLSIQTGEQNHAGSLVLVQGQTLGNNEECHQIWVLTYQKLHLAWCTISPPPQAASMTPHWLHTSTPALIHSIYTTQMQLQCFFCTTDRPRKLHTPLLCCHRHASTLQWSGHPCLGQTQRDHRYLHARAHGIAWNQDNAAAAAVRWCRRWLRVVIYEHGTYPILYAGR